MKKVARFLIYMAGLCLLALGIVLNTKTTLGVAPINSMAYTVSVLLDIGLFGPFFVMQCLFFAAIIAVKGKNLKKIDFLEVPVSVVFSSFVGVFDETISLVPQTAFSKAALLIAACVITGIGITLILDMRIAPSPPDGFMQAVADRLGKDLGLVKNFVDCGAVLVGCSIGLIFGGRIIGIGIGTVVTMVMVGRVVWLVNKLFKKKLLAVAGMEY